MHGYGTMRPSFFFSSSSFFLEDFLFRTHEPGSPSRALLSYESEDMKRRDG